MKSHEGVRAVLQGLAAAGLEFVVMGGLASNHYGVARATGRTSNAGAMRTAPGHTSRKSVR